MNGENIPFLTVFTPSFNRAHLLPRCYESMKAQKCKDFIWMIIDDGSTDNTEELVKKWQSEENGLKIEYIYKPNGGMHTAHNTAYENIRTELNVCIDSDDLLADDAVSKIKCFWEAHGSERYAGILGLDADFDGNIIGKGFPENLKECTLGGYYAAGGKGDKKLVYRTDVITKYPPYPVFEGEKFVALGYKYTLCDDDYKLLVLDEVLCNVEYQTDGSTNNMYRQYRRNPKGWAFMRIFHMHRAPSKKRMFELNVHYVSSCIFAKDKYFLKKSPKKLWTIVACPFGLALNLLIRFKTRGK
ncbi:MAG: glycosyltransferase family 2 protein [Ruminococcaceae bacterium]|nr:glycosyltransferase family 2 protein [Oscillospiraceae bacterium]